MTTLHRSEFCIKETKVKVISDSARHAECAREEIVRQRGIIEDYILRHPEFRDSLEPLGTVAGAPPVIREMAEASRLAGVGPMAAVAGVIAEFACRRMREEGSRTCLVENGGDVFAITDTPLQVALFAGAGSKLNDLCIELDRGSTPTAVCSSSSYMGHSLSLGRCDLATVISGKASVADAFATATCNRIKSASGMKSAVERLSGFPDIRAAIAVKDGKVSIIGDTSLLRLHGDKRAGEKITAHDCVNVH
jgi:ApbE superfamily uncharacterized protein (UPF0280 family)